MLKEMILLVTVLWGIQGMPTPTPPQEEDFQALSELYCKAEALLLKYKSVDMKFLSPQTRPDLNFVFSQPGCNFTKPAEKCQILRAFQALFLWLQSTYPQEGLLQSVMRSLTLLIDLQENHMRQGCLEEASDKVPEITCPKYSSGKPELENMFHYIFELYRNHTDNLWRSTSLANQGNASDVCGAKKLQLNFTK